jgi:hypothetical protein
MSHLILAEGLPHMIYKYHVYFTRTICHIRSYNITKYFIIQFISLDPKFIITSLILKCMKISKIQKLKLSNEHTIHKNEHKMNIGKSDIGQNLARRWGICSAFFYLVMKMQIQRKGHTMELSLTLCIEWILIKSHSYILCSNMEQVQ